MVSYIQQYVNTSITVLTTQVWKLLIALFKVPNTGALTVEGNNMLKLSYKWDPKTDFWLNYIHVYQTVLSFNFCLCHTQFVNQGLHNSMHQFWTKSYSFLKIWQTLEGGNQDVEKLWTQNVYNFCLFLPIHLFSWSNFIMCHIKHILACHCLISEEETVSVTGKVEKQESSCTKLISIWRVLPKTVE